MKAGNQSPHSTDWTYTFVKNGRIYELPETESK